MRSLISSAGMSVQRCCRARPAQRLFASGAGAPEPIKEPERLTPHVPPGATSVHIWGSGQSRFATGVQGSILRFRMPSMDVNFDFRSWAEATGPFRHLKIWTPWQMWHSTDLRRNMFPDVLFVGLTSGAVTYYNKVIALVHDIDLDHDGTVTAEEFAAAALSGTAQKVHTMGMDFFVTHDMFTLPIAPFTLSSIAIGMMLTFRTQNCNARYVEARQHWGAMVNESRAVSARILALVRPDQEGEAGRARLHAVKCVMTFPHTLKYHLTVDGFCPDIVIRPEMTDAEVNAVKAVALRKELSSIWDYNDDLEKAYVDRLLNPNVGSRPLHVLQEMCSINGQVFKKPTAEGGAGLDSIETNEIFRSVTRFQDVLGACERIYKTPIYTGYTRFMSRCIFVWCNALPLALYPLMGPIGTVPSSMIIALFMFGLEDVGTRIEEPFDSLPLWQYCEGIDGSVKQMLAQDELLKRAAR